MTLDAVSAFVSEVSEATDATAAAGRGARAAARALAAEVGAVMRDGEVLAAHGLPTHRVAELAAAAPAGPRVGRVAPGGLGSAEWEVAQGDDDRRVRLLVARSGAHAFSGHEGRLLGVLSHALAAILHPLSCLDEERGARDRIEHELEVRRGADQALVKGEQRVQSIVRASMAAFISLDAEGLILDWSPEAELTFGWSRAEALGRRWTDMLAVPGSVLAPDGRPLVDQRIQVAARHRDGHELPVELRVSRLSAGDTHMFHLFVRDISEKQQVEEERRHAEERLAHHVLHDALTDLPNRVLLRDRLRNALARAERHDSTTAVIFADLDHFGLVNESVGHPLGDHLLVEVAGRLAEALRASDTVTRPREDTMARLGGDEFVVLCEGLADAHGAITVAERMKAALAAPFLLHDQELSVTASIGIALASGNATPDSLIWEAEAAMQQAKQRGRRRYDLFDPAIRARVEGRLRREGELRHAIERRELRVFYQPIVSLLDGALGAWVSNNDSHQRRPERPSPALRATSPPDLTSETDENGSKTG